jgi:hypothetical protein
MFEDLSVLISVARSEVQKRLSVVKIRLKLEKVSEKCYFHIGG